MAVRTRLKSTALSLPDHTLRVELPERSAAFELEDHKTLEDVEREYILRVLTKTKWRIAGPQGAAAILGMNPSTLRSRIQKLDIQKPWI